MTVFNTFLSAMVAGVILINLALLVAAVIWAMGGLSAQPRKRKLLQAANMIRPRKPALY